MNEHLWITEGLASRYARFNELEELYGFIVRELDAIDGGVAEAVGDDKLGRSFLSVQQPPHKALRAYYKLFGKAMGLTADTGRDISHDFDLSEDEAGSQANGWSPDDRRG